MVNVRTVLDVRILNCFLIAIGMKRAIGWGIRFVWTRRSVKGRGCVEGSSVEEIINVKRRKSTRRRKMRIKFDWKSKKRRLILWCRKLKKLWSRSRKNKLCLLKIKCLNSKRNVRDMNWMKLNILMLKSFMPRPNKIWSSKTSITHQMIVI